MGRLSAEGVTTSSALTVLRIQAPSFSAATSEKRDQISALSSCASARLWPQAARVAALGGGDPDARARVVFVALGGAVVFAALFARRSFGRTFF